MTLTRRIPIRWTICFVCVLLGGCKTNQQVGQALKPVSLPDLTRVEESVQAQLRDGYAQLTAKQKDSATRAADLGTEFGEMGKLLFAAGFYDPAAAALVNAETLAPSDMRWPYYLGHLHRTKGDIPSAVAAFERARRLAPDDAPTLIWLGEAALDQGRPEVAEPLFAKALAVQPGSAAANYGLGRTALAKKDYVRAAQTLEQALALDGKASVIHYSLAMAYRGLGDASKAELHLQQRGTLQIQPDPLRKELDGLLHSALTYEKNADIAGNRGEWAEAAEYLRKAVALAPTRASPRHKLGTALFYLGDRNGALNEFQQAVRLSQDFAPAHYALGVVYEEVGDHQHAIKSFSDAIKSEPANVDALLGLANALRRSGQPEASLSEYQRILRIDPGVVRARFGYAAALVRLKRYQEARDWLAEAMDLYPNELAFARVTARLFAAAPDNRVRDGRRALTMAQALMSRAPRTIELVETMAMASAEVGQYNDAMKWQNEAIQAAERSGQRDTIKRLADNLQEYQRGRPCRTPWRADERIEY